MAPVRPPAQPVASLVFAACAGLFFFVSIIKFGNPVILDRAAQPPAGLSAAVYESWPARWGIWLFVPLLAAGLWATTWKGMKFNWVLALPAAWLGWEFVAGAQTISSTLTMMTLRHFTICVTLFFLGYFAMKSVVKPWPLLTGIALALCWVIHAGFEQHFGGLEATRKMLQSAPQLAGLPPEMLKDPEYLKRIASNRIFSTFVYANALAGGLVLLLPVTLVYLWRLTPKVRKPVRVVFVLILGGTGLACLYWSGSRAGWLVALTVGLVALGHSALPLKWKRGLISAVLIVGVAGFAIKNATFFQKQRNSVGARFAYWRAAMLIIESHPWMGTGPGTFSIPYQQYKRPDDEMTRLCHNDYLEQACDSGVLGLIIYTGMIYVVLVRLYRYRPARIPINWLYFGIWLGVFGLCLHSMVEFHLYIPALAWPMFFMMGWLLSFIR
jgi:O-antigen ligase